MTRLNTSQKWLNVECKARDTATTIDIPCVASTYICKNLPAAPQVVVKLVRRPTETLNSLCLFDMLAWLLHVWLLRQKLARGL
jgi:hypothetical protein